MLYNLTKLLDWSYISDIDYTAESHNNCKLKPLRQRFCDKVIFYYIIPFNKDTHINKVDYLLKFIAEYASKNERLLAEHNITITENNIKSTYNTKEGDYYLQYIKVALLAIPVDNVFTLITNETIIQAINAEGIYINDIDFTQDLTGAINKEEIILYLIDEKDYV